MSEKKLDPLKCRYCGANLSLVGLNHERNCRFNDGSQRQPQGSPSPSIRKLEPSNASQRKGVTVSLPGNIDSPAIQKALENSFREVPEGYMRKRDGRIVRRKEAKSTDRVRAYRERDPERAKKVQAACMKRWRDSE